MNDLDASPGDRVPVCECHDEPMLWNKDARKRAGGFWRCRIKTRKKDREYKRRYRKDNPEKIRARELDYYYSLDGFRYCKRRLAARRRKALKRQSERVLRSERRIEEAA